MNAMEPISTHDVPLSHEPVEDWQCVEVSAEAGGSPVAGGADAAAVDASAAGAPEAAVAADLAGASATTWFAELGTIAGADYGLWEMSAGAMRDVEGDEVFLVISGTGRIEFDEPQRPAIDLAPGSLVRLEEGMKTRWYIAEAPLRKLFIAPSEG